MEETETIAFGGSPGQKSLMHGDQKSSLLFGPGRCFQAPLLTTNLALTIQFSKSLFIWKTWGRGAPGPRESWS